MASPSSISKTVLVCVGEHKREVAFASDGEDDKKTLLPAVRQAFSDVLSGEEQLLLQIKREDWNGEFTDLMEGSITDHSVLMTLKLWL